MWPGCRRSTYYEYYTYHGYTYHGYTNYDYAHHGYAYRGYTLPCQALELSGLVAILVCGMVMATYTRYNLSEKGEPVDP
mgnify:CR=1 FL=1